MDSKNFAIGVLSVTAVILLVGILVIHSMPTPAAASGMTQTGGNYVMSVGRLNVNEEVLYVIDSSDAKVLLYAFDIARKQIVPQSGIDLNEYRQAAAGQGQQQQQQPQQRGRPGRHRRP
ncbi:MAG: hypothetical protein JSV78_08525 [Phycisphaerales bacterium]|nr:MAG: hypothetical protein JSV78_08525 [Phycisphaerales bacterium]